MSGTTPETTGSQPSKTQVNIQALIQKSVQADGKAFAYPDTRNIPVEITGYQERGGVLYAQGRDLTSQKDVILDFDVSVRKTTRGVTRGVKDLQEVAPPGATVIFTGCKWDDKTKSFQSEYARTPQTKSADSDAVKNTEVVMGPARIVAFPSGRVGAVLYNIYDGKSIQTADAALEHVANAFAQNKGIYLRVRVDIDSPEDGVSKYIDSYEAFPSYQRVEEGGAVKNFVDVAGSMDKFMQSEFVQNWLVQLAALREAYPSGIDVDFTTTDLVFTGRAAAESGMNDKLAKLYGLGKQNGFFSRSQSITATEGGALKRWENTVTNMIIPVTQHTNEAGTFSYLKSADPVGNRTNFIAAKHLPIFVDGQPTIKAEDVKSFKRCLKTDGTFYIESQEPKQAAQASNQATHQASAKAESTAAPVAAHAQQEAASVQANVHQSSGSMQDAIDAMDSMDLDDFAQQSMSADLYAAQAELAQGTEVEAEMELDDLDLDEILAGMTGDSSAAQPAAGPGMKP